ncbi:MAG: hypothetical protein HBSAPP03_00710 [Phycisphaerae bacterium]|nr:MAG: hypothetical protein HBSAPP03_00710 [Phycisphaerae bacterium]
MTRWVVVFVVVVAAAIARAQVMSAGSLTVPGGGGGHAWLVVPNAGGGATILHVPPRGAVSDGVVRLAGEVLEAPTAIAASGARLYMVFEPPPVGPAFVGVVEPKPRPVLSLTAVEAGRGRWVSEPMGRLEAEASIPGRGEFLGLASSDAGVFTAVLDQGRVTLLRLDGNRWTQEFEGEAGQGPWAVVSVPGGVGVVRGVGADQRLGVVTRSPSGGSTSEVSWRVMPGMEPGAGWNVLAASGQVMAWRLGEDGTLSLYGTPATGGGAWRRVGEIPGVGAMPAVAPLDEDARVMVAWMTEETKPPRGQPGDLELRELSASSGRVFYEGRARLANPVAMMDLAVLVGLMAVLAGSIVVTVWRPRDEPVVLPKDASLAEPLRRMVGGVVDLSLAMVVAAMASGESSSQWMSISWWASPGAQGVILRAVGGLIVMGTVMEAVIGRTPGKFLTGAGVVTVRRGSDAWRCPSLLQAFVRNVIKWGLPPVGLMALFDPAGRARADQFAGTAVVIRSPETADE